MHRPKLYFLAWIVLLNIQGIHFPMESNEKFMYNDVSVIALKNYGFSNLVVHIFTFVLIKHFLCKKNNIIFIQYY